MSEAMQAPRRRPLGVTIIALLDIITGLIALVGGILGFLGLGLVGERIPVIVDAVAGVALVIAILIAVASLVLGWGLWTLKPWAFWATVIVEVLTIADHLLGWLTHHLGTTSSITEIVIPVIIIVYLFADRNVRAAFRT